MEHRLVLAVIAEKRDVLAEIHILEMIGDKASVTTLYALAEFLLDFFFTVIIHRLPGFYHSEFYHAGLAISVQLCFHHKHNVPKSSTNSSSPPSSRDTSPRELIRFSNKLVN